MRELAGLRDTSIAGKRTIAIAPVGYEQFRQMAWTASQTIQDGSAQAAVPIGELRRALRQVPHSSFNQHLLRLERNGLVYLIPPEDMEALSAEARLEALSHPAGDLRAFLLWMRPKMRTACFWD